MSHLNGFSLTQEDMDWIRTGFHSDQTIRTVLEFIDAKADSFTYDDWDYIFDGMPVDDLNVKYNLLAYYKIAKYIRDLIDQEIDVPITASYNVGLIMGIIHRFRGETYKHSKIKLL